MRHAATCISGVSLQQRGLSTDSCVDSFLRLWSNPHPPFATLRSVSMAEASQTGMTRSWKQGACVYSSSLAFWDTTAASCPPAEKPPTAIRVGSMLRLGACSTTCLYAAQESSMATGKRCSGAVRYPTSTAMHRHSCTTVRRKDASSPTPPMTHPVWVRVSVSVSPQRNAQVSLTPFTGGRPPSCQSVHDPPAPLGSVCITTPSPNSPPPW